MVEDLDGVEVIMDDVIVAEDETTHDERLQTYLEKVSKKGLITKEREMYNPPEGSALHRTSTHRRGP